MKLSLEKVSQYVSMRLDINPHDIQDYFAPATKEDLDGLLELRNNIFKGQPRWDDRSYLKWRYSFDENSDNHNRIWVFKIGDNILACLGIEEVTLCINSKKVCAHKPMDILVKPELDGKGLGVWMTLAVMNKLPTLFATGSNKNSYPIVSKLFCEMPHKQTFKLFVRANTILKNKVKNELFCNFLSTPINLVLSIYQKLLYKGLPDGYTLKLLNSIPEQVDDFLDENSKRIYVQRTKKYLDWRFIDNPRRQFIILGLYLDNKLTGVSFSLLQNSITSNQKDGFIIDWVYEQPSYLSNRTEHYLLQETVKYLKKEKLNSITSTVSDVSVSSVFHRLGFIKRDCEHTFFTHTSDKNLEKYLYNNKLWHLTESDSDTDLF